MRTAERYYTWTLLGMTFGLVAVWYAAAVYFDPYGVFGLSGFNQKNFLTNDRYQKVEHLRRDTHHNAFVLGSSRVNFYDVERAGSLTGWSYYNMTASGETSLGILRKLRWLVRTQPVNHVLIGVDFDFQFMIDAIAPTDFLRQEHPLVSGESYLSFFSRYLSVKRSDIRKVIRANHRTETEWINDIASGQFRFPEWERRIEEDHAAFVDSQFREQPVTAGTLRERSVRNLAKTVDLLDRAGIRRDIVINPYHRMTMGSFRFAVYAAWLRPRVGDWVLDRVLGSAADRDGVPEDFGRLLTSSNVQDRIEELREEYRRQGSQPARQPSL